MLNYFFNKVYYWSTFEVKNLFENQSEFFLTYCSTFGLK